MRVLPVLTSMLILLTSGCDEAPSRAAEAANAAPLVRLPRREQSAHSRPASTKANQDSLPADVVAFRTKRDECDHFRGEEATDEARAAELEKLLDRTCKGTAAELTGLRERYRDNASVLTNLANYDNEVE